MKKYTVEKRKIPSTGRDIKILIFRPTVAKKEPVQTPGILWIHGGGYIDVDIEEALNMKKSIQQIEVDVLRAMTGI